MTTADTYVPAFKEYILYILYTNYYSTFLVCCNKTQVLQSFSKYHFKLS